MSWRRHRTGSNNLCLGVSDVWGWRRQLYFAPWVTANAPCGWAVIFNQFLSATVPYTSNMYCWLSESMVMKKARAGGKFHQCHQWRMPTCGVCSMNPKVAHCWAQDLLSVHAPQFYVNGSLFDNVREYTDVCFLGCCLSHPASFLSLRVSRN